MSIKKFGAKDINLISPTGTPNITSPGELNLNAQTVAISTDLSIGGEITSDLDVVGVATFQDTTVFNGSVGIGTSVPQGALEVIGNVRISGILTANIPNLIPSDDDKNTFIGEDAGGGYDPSSNDGIYNVAIGYSAGSNLSSGDDNIFLGYSAGFTNISGINNTFLGHCAGAKNSGGSNNFMAGFCAGHCGLNPSDNVFIGQFAGFKNAGSDNIFLGRTAGMCNAGSGSDASDNIFLGCGAGYANCTASYNISIGEGSGYCNQASNDNITLGRLAGCRNTGEKNIIVGSQAARNKVGGSSNIFLGDAAGNNVSGGSNNVVIGKEVNPAVLSGSSQLAIGFGANTWINGDPNFNVGIGVTDPTVKLDVLGVANVSSDFNVGAYKNANGSDSGVVLFSVGAVKVNRPSGQQGSNAWLGAVDGNITSRIYAGGDAHFNGKVGIKTDAVGSGATDALLVGGHVIPSFHNAYDIGSDAVRWRNIYTTDLKLSNEGKTNDVDGTWGNYTIQEGEDDLYLINHRNGKKYKFVIQEVN